MNEKLTVVNKTDRTMHKIGLVALLVASFCWGWNSQHFKTPKNES